MASDLEDELVRVAYAIAGERAFTTAELVERLRYAAVPSRLGHALLAHVIDGLAASLVDTGMLARSDDGGFVVTAQARGWLERSPAYLDAEPCHGHVAEIPSRVLEDEDA